MFRHNQFLTFGRTNPKTKSPWKETHQSLDAIIDPSEPIVDLATNLGGTANVEEPTLPVGRAPAIPQPLYQEQGSRYSRALPYELHVSAQGRAGGTIALKFRNTGKQGAVFHVYDRLHLDRIPRRYSIGKAERRGGLAVHDHLELGRQLHREIARLRVGCDPHRRRRGRGR